MDKTLQELADLFKEAKERNEFEFIQILINYRGIGSLTLSTNLHEWFESIEFYERLYRNLNGKEKTRMGTLLYSIFFENSDFYNILGSLCRVKLGYRGSSYLFWKTKKYERLLGIGEKQDFLMELLEDSSKSSIATFFTDNHFKQIRNTFFHSAYSLSDDGEYILHDSDSIIIEGIGHFNFNVIDFFYPIIENVLSFYKEFKRLYLESFSSYTVDKEVIGFFPNKVKAIIMGSETGLKGFKIKDSISIYGKLQDSGIWFAEDMGLWSGFNIHFDHPSIETIEISDQLTRFEAKNEIRHDAEFQNLIEKIVDRNQTPELIRAVKLLIKYGDYRYQQMTKAENHYHQQSMLKKALHNYKQAIEVGKYFDVEQVKKQVKELELMIKP